MKSKEMSEKDRKILQNRLKERRLFLDMTYQDLANKTGLSKSTLQRYETGGIKNLPYDKIFILSEALEVSPSYFTDLSQDYTGETSDQKMLLNRESLARMARQFEEESIKKITPSLISDGYKVEQHSRGSIGDLVAIKGSKVWHIDFMYQRDVNQYPSGLGIGRQQLLMRLGRLAVYDKPITKYSIAVSHTVIAEQFTQQLKPVNLNVQVSILVLTDDGYKEFLFNE